MAFRWRTTTCPAPLARRRFATWAILACQTGLCRCDTRAALCGDADARFDEHRLPFDLDFLDISVDDQPKLLHPRRAGAARGFFGKRLFKRGDRLRLGGKARGSGRKVGRSTPGPGL